MIKNVLEALADARQSGRGLIWRMERGDCEFDTLGTPITFDPPVDMPRHYPPRIGEHTREVLREIVGLSEDELSDLVTQGVAVAAPLPA